MSEAATAIEFIEVNTGRFEEHKEVEGMTKGLLQHIGAWMELEFTEPKQERQKVLQRAFASSRQLAKACPQEFDLKTHSLPTKCLFASDYTVNSEHLIRCQNA